MAISPNNFLKLSVTNIRDLCSNFADCETFLQSNSPNILPLCETNLDTQLSVDSSNFSVRGYLPLFRKRFKDSRFSTGLTSLAVLILFPL